VQLLGVAPRWEISRNAPAFDAVKMMCLDNIFDPVRDYLDSVKWDGKSRLDCWLITYCGADDTPLNRAIGRKNLVAAVRRVRQPGCKFDYITALESILQGIGKSTVVRILAGDENFSDAELLGMDKREQQEATRGVWLYEIGELEGMQKSDVTHIKLFASKTVDSARPAYARSRVDRPRRCIFIATTNEETYLRDTTGNRRFWPVRLHGVVPCGDLMMIDLAGVERDRDQLWAEAVVAERTGEPLVISEKLWPDAKVQQEARMEVDPWADAIEAALHIKMKHWPPKVKGVWSGQFTLADDKNGNGQWRVSSDFLLVEVLELPKQRQSNNHTKRLAKVMRSLGWELNRETMRIGDKVLRGYFKPQGQGEVKA
jgi:predicted P-loop ATPase